MGIEPSILYRREFPIEGGDFSAAGRVSTDIKAVLREIGFNSSVIRRVAIASYEAEMNVAMYARRAILTLEVMPDAIVLTMADEGPGIEDIALAMQEGYSTASEEMRGLGFGAGMGLPNIERNSDLFEIESKVNEGTRLRMTMKVGPVSEKGK